MAPVPVGLFQAQRVERMVAGQPQAERRPRRHDALEHVGCELRGDIKFPAELAHIGDARRPHPGETQPDFAAGTERETGIGHVVAGQRCEHIAGARAHQAEHGVA